MLTSWQKTCFILLLSSCLLSACGFSSEIHTTNPSATEQLLIVRALERTVMELDLSRYYGRRVWVDMHAVIQKNRRFAEDEEAPGREYAEAYLATQLQKNGARLVQTAEESELRLQVFISVLGIDYAESLLGIPAIPVPISGLALPELALFKSERSRGYGEIKIFTFDKRTGDLKMKETLLGTGTSEYNRYTLLLIIGITKTDLFENPG